FGREIGVDIEKTREDVETGQLAERFFSVFEVAELQKLPSEVKITGFFRTWTCKEAFIKAQGTGLSMPLDSFDVEVDVGKPAALLATRPDTAAARRWSLRLLDVPPGYAAALAVEGIIGDLTIMDGSGVTC